MGLIWLVPVAGIGAALVAALLARDVLRRETGTPEMQDIGGRILEGAMAFLRRQYLTIALLTLAAAAVLGVLLSVLASTDLNEDGFIAFSDVPATSVFPSKVGGWKL